MCVVASFLAVFAFSFPLLSIKVLLLGSLSACPASVLPAGMLWLLQRLCTQRGSSASLYPWYSPLDSCDPLISGIWGCTARSSVWGLLSARLRPLQLFPSLEFGAGAGRSFHHLTRTLSHAPPLEAPWRSWWQCPVPCSSPQDPHPPGRDSIPCPSSSQAASAFVPGAGKASIVPL